MINDEIIRRFKNGENTKTIAKELGFSTTYVHKTINEYFELESNNKNIELQQEKSLPKEKYYFNNSMNQDLKKVILEYFNNGMNTKDIAKKLNITLENIESVICKRYKLQMPDIDTKKTEETITKVEKPKRKRINNFYRPQNRENTRKNKKTKTYPKELLLAVKNDYEQGLGQECISQKNNIEIKELAIILKDAYKLENRFVPIIAKPRSISSLIKKNHTISQIRELSIEGNVLLFDKNIELALKTTFPNKDLYYLSNNINKYNFKNNLIEEQERISKKR